MASVTTYHRGHPIHAEQDEDGVYAIWKYSDGTNIRSIKDRSCIRCGNTESSEGHDHCIANLPNVEFACCGHGEEDGYMKLNDGKVIRFNTELNRTQIIELINGHEKRILRNSKKKAPKKWKSIFNGR
jgi:hypothetical protein